MKNIFSKIVNAVYIINAIIFLFSFSIVEVNQAERDTIIVLSFMFIVGLSMVMYAFGESMLQKLNSQFDLPKINYYLVKSIAYLFLIFSIFVTINDIFYFNFIQNIEIQKQSIVLVVSFLFEGALILLYLNQAEKKKELILEDNINLG